MRSKRWISIFGATLFVLLVVFVLNLLGGGMVGRATVNAVAARTLSCDRLPALEEVQAAVDAHGTLFEQIEAVNPGFVSVHVLPREACPGRALLTIAYATERDREAIEDILRESAAYGRQGLFSLPRLFDIPIRLDNV